jgi:acyl dehydratase
MASTDMPKSTSFDSPRDFLKISAGQLLGSSEWLEMTQERINQFADATGDHQWIHVDEARAKTGPFGACIAHGYLTLSLVNYFFPKIVQVQNYSNGINYGCNRVRFPAPVRVGARIRAVAEALEVNETKDGGFQIEVRVTVEIDGEDRPACVADTINRFYP